MRILNSIVLIAWIAAFFRTILNLTLIPRLRAAADSTGPLVSVIIPARNEAAAIERTVRAMLAQTYSPLEVLVVDDRSEDATGSILEAMAREDARLRVVAGSEPPAGWLGKPWALQQGSRAARGEILLFVDADILYEPPAVAAAVAHVQRSGAAMVALAPHLIMGSVAERVAMPMLAMALYVFIPTWLSNRTTFARLGIGGGTGNMIRRSDYEAAGGHETLRDAVVDDVGMARLLRRHRCRTVVVRAGELVSVRMYEGGRAIVEGFTKNSFAVFGRSYIWTLAVVALSLIFHVLPYAWAAAGEWLAVATVILITLTRALLFRSLRYPFHYALWAHPAMILMWTWIMLRSMWLTGVRRQLAWRGRSYDAAATRFGGEPR